MPTGEPPLSVTARSAQAHISGMTAAKVRIFLSEIAEGVSNYRSMHSLTQQVEHQYHDRFLIELLQNAHDALGPLQNDDGNRIAVVFMPDDSEHGSLLVANDGEPFSHSNFERLSQLGQSDKNPEKSIGNKGIGFRSVLEISERPEIYSRAGTSSATFDGYCFAFDPEVIRSLVSPITSFALTGQIPESPVSGAPLVDWSHDLITKFRDRVAVNGFEWLAGECRYLSPYLLPIPIAQTRSPGVASLEAQGFATVVRLPLKSGAMQDRVLRHISSLSPSTILFLEKLGKLTLDSGPAQKKSFKRSSQHLLGSRDGRKVSIAVDSNEVREYAVWSAEVCVSEAPESFREAVVSLPGKWPEIERISTSIAIRLGDVADTGCFSIYLPTLVPTGSAVHVNAPFFGDMSRTSISFQDPYNSHLLDMAAALAVSVVGQQLAGKGESEAQLVIDVLAPHGTDTAARERWSALVGRSADQLGLSIDDAPLVLAEDGWQALAKTSLVPVSTGNELLTESLLRRHATFDIFHSCLSSRRDQIKSLAERRYPNVGAFPLQSDVASTIASVAQQLHADGGDWNAFWRDVTRLLPGGQQMLAEHEVLLGADGRLHKSGSAEKVFFLQRQGTQDDGDVGAESGATDVPPTLQSHVAFLSDQIQLYDPNKPTVQTSVRAYLGNGLVSQFRVETIFSGIFQELTPALPTPIEGDQSDLCKDILDWAARLIGNLIARGRGSEASLRLLRSVPVPCQGGWYPMGEASFGDGWSGTSGSILSGYLSSRASPSFAEAQSRLLLPPDSPAWGTVGIGEISILKGGGVFDGLRLQEIKSSMWASGFRAASYAFSLPATAPPGIGAEFWTKYRAIAESETNIPFSSLQPYAVGDIHIFPGFFETGNFSEDTRTTLSELILGSIVRWSPGLAPLQLVKQSGQSDRRQVTSPLRWFLTSEPWLAISSANGNIWAKPSDRWHVPADTLTGRAKHFQHLKALPSDLARTLDTNEALAGILRDLGMPRFDLGTNTTSPRLMNALVASVGTDDAPDANVLLGQVRDAWHQFRPPMTEPALKHLIVRGPDKRLSVVAPTETSPAYLPDHGAFVSELEQFGLPVLTIYPDDAKALKEWFASAYGARVQLTSLLNIVPVVNGVPWSGSSAIPIGDSEIGWLIPPLLAMVAFHGQFRGIHSTAFQERLESLRQARIDWVEDVSAAVTRGGESLLTTPAPALWDPERKAIVAGRASRANPAELSVALSQLLRRDDLELPLRVVLSSLASIEDQPADPSAILSPLRISAEQVQQVVEHLRGDVSRMARLLRVLVTALTLSIADQSIEESTSEPQLLSRLTGVGLESVDFQAAVEIARKSQDMFDFGRAAWRQIGDGANLVQWNAALELLGQPRLANRNAAVQLRAGLEEAAGLMKRVIAHLIRQGCDSPFATMLSQYEALLTKVDLSGTHWEVDFQAAMDVAGNLVASWTGGGVLSPAILAASSVEELRESLLSLGLPLEVDPDETFRRNHRLLETTSAGIEARRLAWWLNTGAERSHGAWKGEVEGYRTAAATWLSGSAFSQRSDEAEVFDLIKRSAHLAQHPDFLAAVMVSTDLASLQSNLPITHEDVASVEVKLEAIRAESERRQSIIRVCGEDFDGSDENRSSLWGFLQGRVPYDTLAAAVPLDLGKLTPLAPAKPSGPRGAGERASMPPRKQPRQSKSMDELIGFAGEIFVFQMFQRKYGPDIVSASAWVSENSKIVFPHNNADDGRGCDFSFSVKGKSYRVEVKASSGDDQTFTLGSSEIALAMRLASKRRGRREIFSIVHVTNALSATPKAVVLPNPYDPAFAGQFRMEQADARVRYRSKS